MLRRVVRSGVVALLVCGTVLLLVWSLQRRLVYLPDTTAVPPAGEVVDGARDLTVRTADGLESGAWLVPADPATDTGRAVLLAPGNAGNRAGRAGLARELRDRGFAVLLMDYRGYGGNPGDPTEEGLAADADAAAAALEEVGYPAEHTYYLGESLGTGVVAALAARRPPAGMLLRSPFTELADVGSHHYPWLPVRTLLRDRYPVVEHVVSPAASHVPVTVVYGLADAVVPPELSAEVADAAPSLVERLVLEGVGHNDTEMSGAPVADALVRLAEASESTPRNN